MRYTMKQVATVVSIIFLLLLTALACYGIYMTQRYSLPIPITLSAFAAALPAIAGVVIKMTLAVNERKRRLGIQASDYSLSALFAPFLLVVYETVLVTLSATHIAPVNGLKCGLDEKWLTLFRNKDSNAIRAIQDTFHCCGLHTPVDKAWPFPDKNHDAKSCQAMLGWDKGCFEAWQGTEQNAALSVFLVALLVFAWKVSVLAKFKRPSWLAGLNALAHDEERPYSYEGPEYTDRDVQEVTTEDLISTTDDADGSVAGRVVQGRIEGRTESRVEERHSEIISGLRSSLSTGNIHDHGEYGSWGNSER